MTPTKDPKRVAAGKKSKRKGSSFELKIAKQFKEWWGKGEFCRSPGSGGWGRPQHRDGFNACGDIITTNRDFPWTIECKHQEGWTLDQLLLNDGCIIHSWWEQCTTGTQEGLMPMLIFKKNNQAPMVMLLVCGGVSSTLPERARCFYLEDNDRNDLVIFSLEYLFEVNPDLLGRINDE